jgi:tRNA A37 N6-isopentenylltransferase MiaA
MHYPVEAPVVVLVGPTAVGKTALALELADELDAEIISADSRLFYRGMDIGTAKPTPQELRSVPHHLIDVVEPDQTYSLALFQKEAVRIIADIQKRGKLPLVGGGTGQYVRAITEGWSIPPSSRTNTCAQLSRTGRRDRRTGAACQTGAARSAGGCEDRLAKPAPHRACAGSDFQYRPEIFRAAQQKRAAVSL